MSGRARNWDRLKQSTRDRYLAKGRKQGLTAEQVKSTYLSGVPLGEWRGHRPHPGASERQWSALVKAAKLARLQDDVEGDYTIVLESLLAKGYKPAWILAKLAEKRDSRDTYRSSSARIARAKGQERGWNPGRKRFHSRAQPADIELYWYH